MTTQFDEYEILIEVVTYELLGHIKTNFFSTNPENRYISGYFNGSEDTVLQVILEYYVENNPDYKKTKNKQVNS